MNTNKIVYKYADGSANQYNITPVSLQYIPVKPEESSTGLYSGGEPKTVSISNEQFQALKVLFENAINNPTIHIEDRIKTSGLIILEDRSEPRRYIIQPRSKELIAIESALKKILHQ